MHSTDLNRFVKHSGTRKLDQLAQLRQQRSLHLLVATVGRLLDWKK